MQTHTLTCIHTHTHIRRAVAQW